jgi:hypothetical protein
MFLCRDIEFSKNSRLPQTCQKNRVYLKIQYLDKERFFSAETLSILFLVEKSLGNINCLLACLLACLCVRTSLIGSKMM